MLKRGRRIEESCVVQAFTLGPDATKMAAQRGLTEAVADDESPPPPPEAVCIHTHNRHMNTVTHNIYIYIYILCVCVCVCVCMHQDGQAKCGKKARKAQG